MKNGVSPSCVRLDYQRVGIETKAFCVVVFLPMTERGLRKKRGAVQFSLFS